MGNSSTWTVMVFMGADRIAGDADLTAAAYDDIAEMEQLFVDGESKRSKEPIPPQLQLFVQLHGDGGPHRWQIGATKTEHQIEEQDQSVVDGRALLSFMKWAVKTSTRAPDHLMLVLWGHAYNFAIGRAENRSGIDALDFGELAAVLKQFKGPKKLDVVGFDACDLATIEMAYQLRDSTDYLLASEIGIPLPGWPYNRVLDRLLRPKERQMGPAELGSYVVRRYCEAYTADEMAVSLTLLDLRLAEEVKSLTETLSRRLAEALSEDASEVDIVLGLFIRSQTDDGRPFVDAADLCLNLVRYSSNQALRDAAERLGNCLLTARPVEPGQSEYGTGRPFVAEHGRNACRAARLHGVALYAPHVSASHDAAAAKPFYAKLAFASETLWGDIVEALADANA
jgi:hypothetical protein